MASKLVMTPVADIPAVVSACRAAFRAGKLHTVPQRKAIILKMLDLLDENESMLIDAVKADLGKPAIELKLMELSMVRNETCDALNNIASWVVPERARTAGIEKLDTTVIKRDPLGTVLIIGAWNYPIQLTLTGVVGALAAGNTVVLKPSEVSSNTALALQELLAKYFDPDVVSVIQGGVTETTALLKEQFDHILYTGNGRVAKIVMRAAAEHLTPVSLELGGKSPVIVDKNADLRITARRILWGRMANAGQTCIAPDYILVHPDVKAPLIDALKVARTEFLGEDVQKSPDYGRIIHSAHYDRVVKMMSGGKIVVGGEHDAVEKFIAPTVLDDVDLDSPLMTEEIFGPLLPLVPCSSAEEAIKFINARDKPLALYIFSASSAFADDIIDRTSSGGVVVNDTLMHVSIAGLPFGGVGPSGMGAYHGRHTFEMFSHRKAVLKKMLAMEQLNVLRYPPYTEKKYGYIMSLLGKRDPRKSWFSFW